MANKRYIRASSRKNLFINGKKICAYCKEKETISKYHKYCSEECANHSYLEAGMNIRGTLRKRDKEICACCGLNCSLLKKIAKESNIKYHYKPIFKYIGDEKWEKLVSLLNIPQYVIRTRCFWAADHIIEVRDGGKTTLNNLQTLCWNCHYCKTHKKEKQILITEEIQYLYE